MDKIEEGSFLRRPNRFIVECRRKGRRVKAYLPNPGRLRELLLPGARLYLTRDGSGTARRTAFTVIGVERDGMPVFLHTHLANDVVELLLNERRIPQLKEWAVTKREPLFGKSRFDFLLGGKGKEMVLEVKSCTLFGNNIAMFPDAVTARGRRHLLELAGLSRRGYAAAVVFLVQWPRADYFMPDFHTDIEFSRTMLEVRNQLNIIPLAVEWDNDFRLTGPVKVLGIPWDIIEEESRDRGSYILLMRLDSPKRISVGSLGMVQFRQGHYLYAGSAGKGLAARVGRHMRKRKKMHWHIDFLCAVADAVEVLPIRSGESLECLLAEKLMDLTGDAVDGFGSSDCACDSHLFYLPEAPVAKKAFIDILLDLRINRLGEGSAPLH